MKTKIIIGLIAVLAAGYGIWLVQQRAAARKDRGRSRDLTVPVSVAEVVRTHAPVELRAFGNVEPYTTVAVKSQVTGVITNVHFAEGQTVKNGDLLFSIDQRPFETALNQANASLARDKAQRDNAEKEARRQEELFKKGFASEDARDQSRAAAESLQAVVRGDEAAAENARLQLEYCSIRAPSNGRTGSLLVHQGNLVKAGEATLVVLNQIAPVRVSFTLPQQALSEVTRRFREGTLEVKAWGQGEARPETGTLTFVDNAVERATGTVQLKGTFENPEQRLWPGQFVDIVLMLYVQTNILAVPLQAVQPGQKGDSVYVVKPDLTVEYRLVTVDREFKGYSLITQGLTPGEKVVTDGQLRLTNSAKIKIKGVAEGEKVSR